jgi:hypothetical protein
VRTCAHTTELVATGINCRVAAGRDTTLDMLRDEDRCIGASIRSKVLRVCIKSASLSIMLPPYIMRAYQGDPGERKRQPNRFANYLKVASSLVNKWERCDALPVPR